MNRHLLLGFDLGTQSGKCVLMDLDRAATAVARRDYPIATPQPGAAEQDPELWWRAFCECCREALAQTGATASQVAGISFSGQMHGLVAVDACGKPVRPAIIWADSRGAAFGAELIRRVGEERFVRITRNRAPAGFLGTSALWLRRHEPDAFRRVRTFLSPKDYLRYRVCGELCAEPTDACATALFDVARRQWSAEILEAAGFDAARFPRVRESCEVVGHVTPQAATETGLAAGTPVVAGAGDQPCAAIGNGVLDPGRLLLTIGTGGQLFAPTAQPVYDAALRTHTFCHAQCDRWYVMGATLSAGLSLRWLRDTLGGGADYDALMREAAATEPGAAGVLFLPHLLGERTPYFDAGARGAFVGLSLSHRRGHLVRAVLEGVAMSQRACLEIISSLGIETRRIVFTGGAARSCLWQQVVADVLGRPVLVTVGEEHAACGAAVLAGVGVNAFGNLRTACRTLAPAAPAAEPRTALADLYERQYRRFSELYDRLRPVRSAHNECRTANEHE